MMDSFQLRAAIREQHRGSFHFFYVQAPLRASQFLRKQPPPTTPSLSVLYGNVAI
jgi:hypothetical protein